MTYLVRVEGGYYYRERGHHHSVLKTGVRKRYNEFKTLHRQLYARYGREGLLVPPLPPALSGTQDADFVKRRMSGLALFLEAIAASPFLALDSSVERFLTTTSEENGTIGGGGGGESLDLDEMGGLGLDESAGGSISGSGAGSSSSSSNRGYQLWQEHLAGFANPPQADVQLAQIRNELEVAERGLREAVGASKGLGEGLSRFASALQGFSQALHVAAEGESSIVALNDEGASEEGGAAVEGEACGEGPSVPVLVNKTAALYSAISPGYAAAQDQLGHLFAEILEYELAAVHALKGLLQGRAELAAALLKLQRKLHALRHRNDPGRAAELALLEAQVGKEELRCYKYTKALLRVAVPGAAAARARNLRRAFAHLAAVTTGAGGVHFNAALAYLAQLGWTPQAVVDGANDAAAALVLPPVPAITLPSPAAGVLPAAGQKPKRAAAAGASGSASASTSASTSALAVAKVAKPGSFLAEPAPIPPSSARTEDGGSAGTNGVFSSVVLMPPAASAKPLPPPPTATGAAPPTAAAAKAKAKAPWDSDDEADDPFTPVAKGKKGETKGEA